MDAHAQLPRLLVVDDEPAILELLSQTLSGEFHVTLVSDPLRALDLVRAQSFDVFLFDVCMDHIQGLELLILTVATQPHAPVLMMTGAPSMETAIEAMRAGASDLVPKPLEFDRLRSALLQALARAKRDGRSASRLEEIQTSLTLAVEAKDPTTFGHGDRVRQVCATLANAIGVDQPTLSILDRASALHDIGKIGVPDAVLGKPGKLTADEYKLIQLHPQIGERILEPVPELAEVRRCVVEHHERWDGAGYPHGLQGEEVSLPGRILIIAEVFDALAHARCYKPAWPQAKIDQFFRAGSGSHFDPELVPHLLDLCRTNFDELLRAEPVASPVTEATVGR